MLAPPAPRLSRAAWAGVLALLVLAAVPAHAQVPAPQVALELDETSLSLGANTTRTINATVRYTDQVPASQGTVTLAVRAPEGWTVVIEPSPTFPLNAGGSQTVTLNVTAPAALTGALEGDALVTATLTAGTGRPPGTAEATLALTRVDPPPPPPPNYTPYYVAAAALVLLAAAGAVVLARRRRIAREAAEAERAAAEKAAYLARETGITIAQAGEPAPFGDRREVAVRLAVKNVSERDRVAVVEVKEYPEGWSAAVNVPRRELATGADMIVTLTARPPPGAPLDALARIVVAARPEEAQERDERVTLHVTAPAARPASHGSAAVGIRDGVVPKVLRR